MRSQDYITINWIIVDLLKADFNLIHTNCTTYNEKETIYYRAGTRMRDAGGSIIRGARRLAEQLQQMGKFIFNVEIYQLPKQIQTFLRFLSYNDLV